MTIKYANQKSEIANRVINHIINIKLYKKRKEYLQHRITNMEK